MPNTPRYLSPLRYPGGKARMAPALAQLVALQWTGMPVEIFMEPFAGGAGAGLGLLETKAVDEIWLVEKHPALAALWQTIIREGEAFSQKVERETPTLTMFEDAKETIAAVLAGAPIDPFLVAYAAFVVNRCSRSGIVTPAAGPIGGKGQAGAHRLFDRWNGLALAGRIRRIAEHGRQGRLRVTEGCAIEHIADLAGSGVEDELFLFVDPPYIREGNRLYQQGMTEAQHLQLAAALTGCPSPWLLTYDDEPDVAERLYPAHRVFEYGIQNTANRRRLAREYAVLSDGLVIPDDGLGLLPGDAARWIRSAPRISTGERPDRPAVPQHYQGALHV